MDTHTWVASIIALLPDPNFGSIFIFKRWENLFQGLQPIFVLLVVKPAKYEYREIACGDWRSEDDTGEIIASVFLRQFTNLLFSPSCSIREGRTWKTHGPKFRTVLLTGYRASLIHNSFWQYICSQYESTTYVVVLDGSDQQVLLYGNDGYAISYKRIYDFECRHSCLSCLLNVAVRKNEEMLLFFEPFFRTRTAWNAQPWFASFKLRVQSD